MQLILPSSPIGMAILKEIPSTVEALVVVNKYKLENLNN